MSKKLFLSIFAVAMLSATLVFSISQVVADNTIRTENVSTRIEINKSVSNTNDFVIRVTVDNSSQEVLGVVENSLTYKVYDVKNAMKTVLEGTMLVTTSEIPANASTTAAIKMVKESLKTGTYKLGIHCTLQNPNLGYWIESSPTTIFIVE